MYTPSNPRLETILRQVLARAAQVGAVLALLGLGLLVAFALSGCGSDEGGSGERSGGSGASDSTRATQAPPSAGSGGGEGGASGSAPQGAAGPSAEEDEGFFTKLASYALSHPRREKERGATCGTTDYSGRSMPFHEMVIDNGNGFNTTHESFGTSTPQAQTPYVAYATWDPCGLYLGLTGSAVGAGDCGEYDGECPLYDRPESPYRYWIVYLDTDPQGQSGSRNPKGERPGPSELPFAADYLVEIRLDGVTVPAGDGYEYQGNAQLYERASDWRVGLEESWRPMGRQALEIGDNSSSNFIEVALDLQAIGDPCAVQAIGWVADAEADEAFAFWPPPRGWKPPAHRDSSRTPRNTRAASPDTVEQSTGLTAKTDSAAAGTGPNAAPADSARQSRTSLAEADSAGRPRLRSVPIDSLQLDVYGFLLTADQKPNASANLNRTDFTMDRCQAQDGAPGE